jgi:hypothetical protein
MSVKQKKNRIYIAILMLGLALVVFVFIRKGTSSTMSSDAFAITDTAQITKIFMVNRNNARIVLKKRGDGLWTLNDSFIARPNKIEMILDVIRRMQIKSPVPKTMMDYVTKELSTKGVKVEVYNGDEKIKSFLVGTDTQDLLGTFMLLDGSDNPQIVHLPGFNGYLSIRFASRIQDWRDFAIFRMEPNQIDQIALSYPNNPSASFKLKIVSENIAQLTSATGDTAKENINGDFFRGFVTRFRNLGYLELVDTVRFKHINTDSVKNTKPYFTLDVTDKRGNTSQALFYLEPKPIRVLKFKNDAYDAKGNPIITPDDIFITLLPNGKEYAVTQWYALEKVLVKYQDFFNKN